METKDQMDSEDLKRFIDENMSSGELGYVVVLVNAEKTFSFYFLPREDDAGKVLQELNKNVIPGLLSQRASETQSERQD